MVKFENLLLLQAKKLKPDPKVKSVNLMINLIKTKIKKSGLLATCFVGGSYAKGTMLKDKFDVDVFVRFDKSYVSKDISELLAIALSSLKPTRLHGSRDYFQLKKGRIVFEIIPVIEISDYKQALNVTDMSPLHVEYALKNYKEKPYLRDEVRLAKQFFKAMGSYGAESHIKGFSGHVIDLLIIYYGGFLNLLMQASVWSDKVILDPAKHLKNPLKELNKSKLDSPLIIVDPVQPDRNAAAAVSLDKFELFKRKAKDFLSSPSNDFFVIKKFSKQLWKKKAGKHSLYVLDVIPVEGKQDVVGSKVLKCHDFIIENLKKEGFVVYDSGIEFGKNSKLFYIMDSVKLSDEKVLMGPPIKSGKFAVAFKKAHKTVFDKEGRLFATEARKYKVAKNLISDLIKDKYVTEKVKKITFS